MDKRVIALIIAGLAGSIAAAEPEAGTTAPAAAPAESIRRSEEKNGGFFSKIKRYGRSGEKETADARPRYDDNLWRKLRRQITGSQLHYPENGKSGLDYEKLHFRNDSGTLSPAAQERRREKAEELKARYARDYDRIQKWKEEYSPAAAEPLRQIALDPLNPFAPEAVGVLAANPGPESLAALTACLQAPLPEIQLAALTSLVALRAKGCQAAAVQMLSAGDARVRSAAILACGELRYRPAAPHLREIIKNSQPVIGVLAAASLARIDTEGEGRSLLEKFAAGDDGETAVTALNFLGMYSDRRAIAFAFNRMVSPQPRIAAAAAANLNRLSPEDIDGALTSLEPETRELLLARWRMQNFLRAPQGQPPSPAVTAALLKNGGLSDMEMVLRCWQAAPSPVQIPLLISLLEHPGKTADAALIHLVTYLKSDAGSHFAPIPAEVKNPAAWKKWWFRQHRLLATAPGQALIQFPDGTAVPSSVSDVLAFSAEIRRITVGSGENNLQGAQMEILCGGRTLLIIP